MLCSAFNLITYASTEFYKCPVFRIKHICRFAVDSKAKENCARYTQYLIKVQKKEEHLKNVYLSPMFAHAFLMVFLIILLHVYYYC